MVLLNIGYARITKQNLTRQIDALRRYTFCEPLINEEISDESNERIFNV